MYRLLLSIILIVFLTGCTNTNDNSKKISDISTEIKETDLSVTDIFIKKITHPDGVYYISDTVSATLEIINPTKEEKELWTELNILNHYNLSVYSDTEQIKISGEGSLKSSLDWTIPQDIKSGNYQTEITVWNGQPECEGSVIIFQNRSEQGIMCYRMKDDFEIINENIWQISDKKLGRTKIKSDNVLAKNGILEIHMPAGALEGGEISTINKQGYGAYEVRMKLPSVKSSITGFFLYEAPDYYYEIDIEVYNDSAGRLLLTTYSDGKTNNEYSGKIGFDPTLEFHDYRFEYYEDIVEFYVDNKFVKSWTGGFPKAEMRLMLNSWYPTWLDGIPAESEQILLVDWIRY